MGLLSLTVNRRIDFVSGLLNLARIHVHLSALYARHPPGLFRVPLLLGEL